MLWATEMPACFYTHLLSEFNFWDGTYARAKLLCCFQSGPMVSGVTPREASDRLVVFQSQFDTLFRKYQTYTAGEVMFGLAVTEYPQLFEVGKELSLLQKLYGLYNDVVDTVSSYYDVLWQDVSVDKITNELQELQHKSATLQLQCTCFKSWDRIHPWRTFARRRRGIRQPQNADSHGRR